MKTFVLVLLLILSLTTPAWALPICRTTATHRVCILDLQRSAKNYWEYWAVVKIDGVERLLETYNCRERVRIKQNGETTAFEADGAGAVICKLFK